MKRTLSVLLIAVCLLGFSACNRTYPYRGEHKELYTTAVYSIPHAEGYMHHGEGAYNPDIYVWEQDDYGRTLFSYCEDYGNQVFALVICQAYDEENVYFYPEANYTLTLIESQYSYEGAEDDHLKNKTQDFYLQSKDKLKEQNDWNKPLDKEKCVSYHITDHKVLGEDVYELSEEQCNEILNAYTQTLNFVNPEKHPHRYNNVLQVDAEGNILHEIYGVHRNYDNPDYNYWDPYGSDFTYYDITLWVITDQDGNYNPENGVMVMYSKANESDHSFIYDASAVKEFKNKNGWKYGN